MSVYKGSCHCGGIQYTAKVDLTAPAKGEKFILSRCNCTICLKSGTTLAVPASFTLQASETAKEYVFARGRIRHVFCDVCGVKTHLLRGKEVCRVNVGTLDDCVDDLREVQVRYWGRREERGMADTPWEGGLW